jgi:transposase
MANHTLGELAKQEIRESLSGLRGPRAKVEVERLSKHLGVSASTVYQAARSVRPARKQRADSGKRRADLLEHEGLRFAAELVVIKHLDPDLALETARLNGFDIPVSDATFVRYLRERGLSRDERRNGRRPYRAWEADAPGELFQFDMSSVKERWLDIRTRRILRVTELEVSKNHPNQNPNRVPLWKFALTDDYSRYKFVRFYAIDYPNQSYVADFLLEAFRMMGVPLTLYTDKDSKITGARMQNVASILSRAFAETGGFKLEQHEAGNAQASGKVERLHLFFEKFERLIGIKYRKPGIEELNDFCANVCEALNWKQHRSTGEKPAIRFNSKRRVLRVPPPAVLNSAFMADSYTPLLTDSLTITIKGGIYQVPQERPFTDWIGRQVEVLWPPDVGFFILRGFDKTDYEITKVLWKPDAAGEFKKPQESTRQRATKALKTSEKERRRSHIEAGTDLKVPFFDSKADTAKHPAFMPQQTEEISPEALQTLTGAVPPSLYGRKIDYWSAAQRLQEEGALSTPLTDDDKAWLKLAFDGRDEMLDTELRDKLRERTIIINEPQTEMVMLRRA